MTEKTESFGGVLFRLLDGNLQVLLVGRQQPPVWGLPKGAPHNHETPEETALREVEEETGVRGRIVDRVGDISYWFVAPGSRRRRPHRYHKTVHYFLMEATGGDPELHDLEYDEVAWFDADEAAAKLTYENERRLLRQALTRLPVATSP